MASHTGVIASKPRASTDGMGRRAGVSADEDPLADVTRGASDASGLGDRGRVLGGVGFGGMASTAESHRLDGVGPLEGGIGPGGAMEGPMLLLGDLRMADLAGGIGEVSTKARSGNLHGSGGGGWQLVASCGTRRGNGARLRDEND